MSIRRSILVLAAAGLGLVVGTPCAIAQSNAVTIAQSAKAACEAALVTTSDVASLFQQLRDAAGEDKECTFVSPKSPTDNNGAEASWANAFRDNSGQVESALIGATPTCAPTDGLCQLENSARVSRSMLAQALASSPLSDASRYELSSDELALAALRQGCSGEAALDVERLMAVDREDPAAIRQRLADVEMTGGCRDAFVRAGRLTVFITYLSKAHAALLGSESARRLAADATRNEAKWEAYNFGGGVERVQLPWELAINAHFYRRSNKGQDILWPEPPRQALTVLHPFVGIAPFESDGSQSGLVGGIEVLGWTRWDYRSEGDGAFVRAEQWGGSLAAVYAPSGDGSKWYPGIVLRTPILSGLNIVYARVDSQNGGKADTFAFSIDLSKAFHNESDAFENVKRLFGLGG